MKCYNIKNMKKIIISICFAFVLFAASKVNAQTEWMEHYWDEVDFSDSALVSSQAFEDKLLGFLYAFTQADESQFDSLTINGLKFVLGEAKANMRVYEYVLGFALNGYTGMGRSVVTDYLLNYPQIAEGEITMEEGLRLDSITEPYQKVRVGAIAPDYSGFTIEGMPYRLYESDSKYVIVVFWSTDCEYCHEFLTQIRRHLDLKADFELVTFALAEGQEEVVAAVKKMRLSGYHFYDDLRWESKAFLDYHITSTPTVFLLDNKKNIIAKPYDWSELKRFFKSNNISY